MKHRVTVQLPERPIEKAAVTFTVKDAFGRMGELSVSQGGIYWLAKGKHNGNGVSLTWGQFIRRVERDDA